MRCSQRIGRRGFVGLLACAAAALAVAVVARSVSTSAPSFRRSVVGTDDGVAVAIGDLNRDGIADIVVANYNSSSVSVGLNRGGGRFTGASYDVGGLARSVAIDDLNGDGKPDIATANEGSAPKRGFLSGPAWIRTRDQR